MNTLILPNAQLQVWCSMPAHNHSFQVSNQLLIPNSSPGPSRGYFFPLPITLPNATSKPPFTLQVHPSPFTFTPRSKPHLALVHNLPEPKPNPGLDLYKIVVLHQALGPPIGHLICILPLVTVAGCCRLPHIPFSSFTVQGTKLFSLKPR